MPRLSMFLVLGFAVTGCAIDEPSEDEEMDEDDLVTLESTSIGARPPYRALTSYIFGEGAYFVDNEQLICARVALQKWDSSSWSWFTRVYDEGSRDSPSVYCSRTTGLATTAIIPCRDGWYRTRTKAFKDGRLIGTRTSTEVYIKSCP